MKLFRGSPTESEQQTRTASTPRGGIIRRSTGLGEFTRAIGNAEDLCILDLGPTSAPNIRHFTGLGYKVYSEDLLLASLDPALGITGEDGKPAVRFRVTDGKVGVPVDYIGVLPDLFREGQGVVTMGTLRADGSFLASEVLAKHDATYMPKDVEEALKKSGHWNPDNGPPPPASTWNTMTPVKAGG